MSTNVWFHDRQWPSPPETIVMDVNSDEAAVLTAAPTSLSRQFCTKNIKLSDIAPYDVQVSYLTGNKSLDPPGLSRRWGSSRSMKRGNGKPLSLVTLVRPRYSRSLIKMEAEEAATAAGEEQ
ncbi:hypothetical protein EDB89DRAFT_1904836 [Lactarius sanguifluus]|nr:hypothetical protein EDB89DRAFT_1904836 [Lactarius sanguifluus]